jgi:hypothetical protein
MKNTPQFFFLFMLSLAFPVYALENTGTESSGGGLAVMLFLGFIAIIIIGQLIPGVMLFFSLIKGMFKKHPCEIKPADHK